MSPAEQPPDMAGDREETMYANPTVDALGAGPRGAIVLAVLVTVLVAVLRIATLL